MKENEKKIEGNPFFTRGCCRTPESYSSAEIYRNSCAKLSVYDWLENINSPEIDIDTELIEVRFKNSKKDFFKAPKEMKLEIGDIVAVEASPGHDIGIVTLVGELVKQQMNKKNYKYAEIDLKRIYRRARSSDIEKWVSAVNKEVESVTKAKGIISDLELEMKLNDVEFQGDNTKAIFYYTAEERVDFRELIKIFAEAFKVRIEMKQIGARQEAARLGGIGSCGRELCCCTWLTNFRSVTTKNARIQQLSLNPQKLAGQCGKLKCCLNYENEIYLEALSKFPNPSTILETQKGEVEFQKADVFKKIIWYSYCDDNSSMMSVSVENAWRIIGMNEKGKKPKSMEDFAEKKEQKTEYFNGLEEGDLTRFDD
ncbi:MAG: hypothetical protein K8R53_12675 [Bacteroidales bacterium]|nr:hypothetical protein [Bacteroidales bacterium]